ncbi:hypothetical protein QBC42DRAFT_346759 [Cladorrhinum samala]|uniref:Leucine-rich repeat-containing protein 40 n=1 Tax=Cladorrhinum samala TaxID=585594 RepID=A0AAV9HPJ4_9PEZI|nr:hypothetical protein QBC42DRAFT_346759 [Cladorrhinum samala]
MDEPRRPTGIPRLSKIPVPGQASRLPVPRSSPARASTSQESLAASNGNGTLRNPKLRATPSRDRLVPASPTTVAATPVPVRNASGSSAQNRRSMSQIPGSASRIRAQPTTSASTNSLTRSTSLRRQPSQQWISASTVSPEEPVAEEHAGAGGADEGAHTTSRLSLAERTMETLSRLPSSPSMKGKGAASFFDITGAGQRSPSRPSSSGSRPGSSHHSEASSGHARSASRTSLNLGIDGPAPISSFQSKISAYQSQYHPTAIPLRNRKSLQSLQSPGFKAPARGLRTSYYGSQPPSPAFPPHTSRSPSPPREIPTITRFGAKTVSTPSLKKRQSVNGLFKKPAVPSSAKSTGPEAPRKASSASQKSTAASSEGTQPSNSSVASGSTMLTVDSGDAAAPGQSYRKASSALREQIAKAKAARRAVSQSDETPESHDAPADKTFGFEMAHSDPFNQHRDDKSQTKVLHSRLESARTSGRLNIAAMGLREIPADVLNMYNLESIGQSGGAWAESVDLSRFVAADNELEMIADDVFPDVDPQQYADDEDSQGNIFAGLETLDLHGNMLISLPMGLRRLSLLTSLNLSLNRLGNNALEVISQIAALRDLKLGGNLLYGELDPCFSNLQYLELLDLHGNNISSLPANFGHLSRLRVLNISENSFEELPFGILASLPLTELTARKNELKGTLIQESVLSLPALQTLDVSSNQLVQLCSPGSSVIMPALHQLCVSMNRLQSLPDVSGWTALVTLSADENSINAIPEGFTSLQQLRTVDFSSNDIRVIPTEIGQMDGLAMLRLSGNPLREKKFSTITTEELKTLLAQRLEPPPEHLDPEPVDGQVDGPVDASVACQVNISVDEPVDFGSSEPVAPADKPTGSRNSQSGATLEVPEDADNSLSDMDDFATPPTSAPGSPTRSRSRSGTVVGPTWPVKPGGVLDRSNTDSSSLHPVICSKVAELNKVTEIQLHHNLFTSLPESLSFFAETLTALSLAHNQMVGETYLGGAAGSNEKIELPALKELNLAHNHISGLESLISRLSAPSLEKLDVSFNRISALPEGTSLRDAFPNLTVLLIANNHLAELDPESIKGMRVVDASSNDIAHLNPRIGLLGGSGGLERLEVGGNRFRVPRYNVLERGTEATLRWLRGRVPVAEMGAWKGNDTGDEEDLD